MSGIRLEPMPPAPCDGCRHHDQCRSEELACTAFQKWQLCAQGTLIKYPARIPSRVIYQRIFGQEEVA